MNKKTGSIFIKGGRIEDPSSYLNGEVADILIENGIITKVGKELVCRTPRWSASTWRPRDWTARTRG